MEAVRRIFVKHPRGQWLIPALLSLLLLAQVSMSVRQMSQHVDEAVHLYGGYRLLKCGDYSFGREHPPLAKVLAAAPLLWSDIPVDCSGDRDSAVLYDEDGETMEWFFAQPNWWSILMRARAAMMLGVLALGMAIWVVARRWFGLGAASLAMAAFVLEPNFIAHGGLILNNIPLSLLFLCTISAYYEWTESRQGLLLFVTGILMGLTLLTKHNAVFLVFVLATLAVVEPWIGTTNRKDRTKRAFRNAGAVAAIVVLAGATIWGFYGMRYSQFGRRQSPFSAAQVLKAESLGVRTLVGVRSAHLLPQAYVDGIIDAVALVHDSATGSALLNRHYAAAPWFTFPLTLLIKLTLGFLGFILLGAIGLRSVEPERRKAIVFLLTPALLYLAAATAVPRFSGVWHLFPALPLMLVPAAAGAMSLAKQRHWVLVTVVTLLAIHAGSSLRAYPHYLSYANEAWGGPANLYRLLPLTDEGQTLWEVRQYVAAHPNTPCVIDVDWPVPAARYGIPCTQTGSWWSDAVPSQTKGIVFVSATWWQIDNDPGGPLAGFRDLKPSALLGGSAMLVYEGELDTHRLAARALENTTMMHFNAQDLDGAVSYARNAVRVAPESSRAHHTLCVMLARSTFYEEAYEECKLGLQLVASDPMRQSDSETLRKQIALLSKQLGITPDGNAK